MIEKRSEQARNALNVPLPTEIPTPPDLAHLPAHILHSGTVETLITQNEDLMARLKVNLRRNGILEGQVFEQERITNELSRTNNSLLAQLQVLQEKERMWKERFGNNDAQQNELKELLEFTKARLQAAEERKDELRLSLRAASSYRRRIHNWVKPMIARMKQELQRTQVRVKLLENQLAAREAAAGDLRSRLSETFTRLQNFEKEAARNQADLVGKYESQLQAQAQETTRLRIELRLAIEKNARVDDMLAAKTEAENRVIQLERHLQERLKELRVAEEKIIRLQSSRDSIGHDTQTLRIERDEMAERLKNMQEQFDRFQGVFIESQKRLETMRMQTDSLTKINQDLSQQLKQERMNRQAEASLPKSTPDIRTQATQAVPLKKQVSAEIDEKDPRRFERIDSLLAELETGLTTGFGKMKGAMHDKQIDEG